MPKNEAKADNNKYLPSLIELKWQSKWEQDGIYQPDLSNANGSTSSPLRPPFYNLMMFPYPSAEGLHIGSIFTFCGVDVYGRFKRMQGNDVFEPIGLDGFGIHSENHALKTGSHPMEHAKRTEENFYRQLRSTGNSYAWKNKVETYDPAYYKWTQWLFIELFKAGLAYKKKSPVNFCPSCKTVLADEQVIEGKCERCSSIVEKKDLEQWFFKITDYAERLLGNIEGLNWTEKVKVAQRNWIGKSQGVNLKFKVKDMDIHFEMFDSVPQTFMAQTFTVIAPEHPQLYDLVKGTEHEKEVMEFVEKIKKKKATKTFDADKDVEGIFTGRYIDYKPAKRLLPIWVASFVIADYGTGVVNASAHDERDFAFAKKYNLPLHPVMFPRDPELAKKVRDLEVCYHHADEGVLEEPVKFKGRKWGEVRKDIISFIEKEGYGQSASQYHLRDWLISRQRYWGPPIPLIYCDSCAKNGDSWFTSDEAKKRSKGIGISNFKFQISNSAAEAAGWYPEENLPVELPFIEDYKPLGTGKSPLGSHPEFYETKCPHCGSKATRETDVSDTFLDSAWYFFRYVSTDRSDVSFDKDVVKKWLPVTMYIGGAEHSVLHLLYARFITMVLSDLGYIDFEEPFARFYAHGLIIKDGAKMSKSKGNVINPDEYIKKFGVDAVRCYLLFLGPYNQGGDFRDTGMEGMYRFIKRVWTLFTQVQSSKFKVQSLHSERKSMMNETVKGVTEDLENLRYNTAIAKLMTYYNFLVKQESLTREEVETYLKLFAPFAPHMTEELWHRLKNSDSIHVSEWPGFDEKEIVHDVVNLAVQVNGKLRGVLQLAQDSPQDEGVIVELAKKDEKILKFLEGKSIKKTIYITGKVLNFVVA